MGPPNSRGRSCIYFIESRTEPLPTLLTVNNYFYPRGGADVLFLEQMRLFQKLGWRVLPFCMQHENNLATVWSDYFVDEIEFGRIYSAWEKIGRIPKIVYSLESRRKLDNLLRVARVDICHVHNLYHHISPSILSLLKERGVPTVLTLHDLKLACPAYKMLTHDGICERCKPRKVFNVAVHRCIKNSLALSFLVFIESALHLLLGTYRHCVDRFVAPSRFLISKMREWGWDPERFVYVPNFVDVDSYRSDCGGVGRAFLYFGRLAAEKGLQTLIKAAARAAVPVWIAGTGPEEAALRRLVASTGYDVNFLGYLTGDALRDAVRASRATVLPSECYENAPMSVLESYACGRPVIGAAIGGIPELIREGETGVTFQSASVESLAGALRRFADEPDSRLTEMGRYGRRWVESDFTRQKYLEGLLTLYGNLGVRL